MVDGPGRRLRKNVANVRKHIDYSSGALNAVDKDSYLYPSDARNFQHPHLLSSYGVLPVKDMIDVPADCVCTRFARAATNKVKCPVYSLCVSWVLLKVLNKTLPHHCFCVYLFASYHLMESILHYCM